MSQQKFNSSSFICTLPNEMEFDIAIELQLKGIEGEDLIRALNSRLCDLEDTINIAPFVEALKLIK